MKWRTVPMPRLLLPFVLGIGAADYWVISRSQFQQLFLWGVAGLLFTVLFSTLKPGFRERAGFGLVLFMFILSLGFFRMEQSQQWNNPQHFSWQSQGDSLSIWAKVLESKPSPRSHRVLLQVKARSKVGTTAWIASKGRMLAYLKLSATQIPPQSGQYLLLSGRLDSITPPLNPDAFDFKAYLARKGVYHQMFAPQGAWKVDSLHRQLPLPLALQRFCLNTLKQYLPQGTTQSVGLALILGERSALSTDIQQAYSNSGAIHVLSVSGLHVGVLAIVLRFLFGFFAQNRYARKLGLGLELGSIWLFTLLTGAAPATLRAAVMFSMIIGARAVARQYNIWNILAASAFALLCWEPNLLWDIGFQLSYLALAGIIAFQPWIYQRWVAPDLFWDYLWKLSSVGLAAQLSTGPLSIYYFHQFPVFFWLSGLVAVPLSGLILILGLGLFLCSALHIPAAWLGQVLSWTIQLLNACIVGIQHLPQAVIKGFWWNEVAVWGMYCILGLLSLALYKRQLRWFNAGLGLLTIWAFAQWPGVFKARQQQVLVCYQVSKASVLDLIQGQRVLSISNAAALPEQMAAQNHRYHRQIKQVHKINWQTTFNWGKARSRGSSLHFGPHILGILEADQGLPTEKCDFLLLRNNPRIYPEDLIHKPRLIILDGSNRLTTRSWVKKLALEFDIPVHDTAEQGAWILNLKITL